MRMVGLALLRTLVHVQKATQEHYALNWVCFNYEK